MSKQQSVISLDPIDRKKRLGVIGKLLISRWYGGKPVQKMEPFGHYMFCGPQGSGKTASALWYAESLARKYKKPNLVQRLILRKKSRPVKLWSNIGVGNEIDKNKIFDTINAFNPDDNEIRIVIIDEIHTYFPKGGADKETQKIRDDLIAIFSQLRKRSTFILSTAQIYGRLDKSLREQCLYMIDNKVNMNGKIISAFIPEKDILCDDLGRWAGNPKHIFIHGLSTLSYDTKKIIRD